MNEVNKIYLWFHIIAGCIEGESLLIMLDRNGICGSSGLPPVKVHCSLLAEEAIHAALWDYAEKNNIKIEGLKPPVKDIDETEEFYAMGEEA